MGLGQISNKRIVKGILFAAIEVYVLIIGIPYFLFSFWGLTTLGETPQYFVNGMAYGDHSIRLLMNGILAIIILIVFIGIYVANIIDAYKTARAMEEGKYSYKKKKFLDKIDGAFPKIVLAPAVIACLFLVAFPLICSFAIAFTNYSSPYHIPPKTLINWVGFDNFKDLFTMDMWRGTFIPVVIWTVIWGVVCTGLTYSCGLFLAIITNSKLIKFKKLWRSILVLPMAMPGFISLLIFRLAFNGMGPINKLLTNMGFEKVSWLTDPTIAKVVLIAVNLWLSCAGTMVFMSGILASISPDLYEAASVDGATETQKFRKITLPLVLYSTAPILVMNLAGSFSNFGVIYLLTDGGPANPNYQYAGSTDILLSWVYKMTMNVNQYSMAASISILIFIFIAIVAIFNLKRTRSFKEEDMIG
jgi:arabinogalactan oligomer/maltooligosaccharide transport system permease protein